MTSTLSLKRRCNLSQKNFSNQCEQAGRLTQICSHIDQRNTQGNTSIPVQWVFWCSLYKPYMLQIYFKKPTRTLQKHPFFNFFLEILKDCDNLISLGARSHIFGPRNEINSVPYLTEFTLRLCNVSLRWKLYGRETGTIISFKMGGEKPCKTL